MGKGHGHSRHVTIRGCHTQALGTDHRLDCIDNHAIGNLAPQLERFFFTLFIFAADIRNDVVHHFRPGLEGLPCAADGLIGAHANLFRLKLHEGRKCRHIALNGAVRLHSNKTTFASESLALGSDHFDMIGVDFRHHHGHIRQTTASTVVADYRNLVLGIVFFQCTDFVLLHIHCTEHEVDQLAHRFNVLSVQHRHVTDCRRDLPIKCPTVSNSLRISFPCTAGGGCQCRNMKPRMPLQKRNKTLTDHTGCTDNAYTILLLQLTVTPSSELFTQCAMYTW